MFQKAENNEKANPKQSLFHIVKHFYGKLCCVLFEKMKQKIFHMTQEM